VKNCNFKFLIICLLNAVLFTSVHAQENSNSILWEITGNGLAKSSYLFGIVNFMPEHEFQVSESVKAALGKCKVFVTKTPINRSSRNEFSRAVRIPNDGWINDYLTDDELNQLRLLMLKDLEVSENDYHFTYSRLQPVILVTATTLLSLGENVVFVEDVLAKAAKKKRLKFISLNTIEEEITAFEDFPIVDQVEALKYTVNNFSEHLSDYNQLVRNYRDDQNLELIHEEILKATNRSEKFQHTYYHERNKDWSQKIKEMMSEHPAFIAVGAAHLYGEEGLVHLLQEEGYTLKPAKAFD